MEKYDYGFMWREIQNEEKEKIKIAAVVIKNFANQAQIYYSVLRIANFLMNIAMMSTN